MRRPARGFLVLIIGKILLITHRLLGCRVRETDSFLDYPRINSTEGLTVTMITPRADIRTPRQTPSPGPRSTLCSWLDKSRNKMHRFHI